MLTGRKYRLDLTPEQTILAEATADACRAVWNVGLEQRREYRRRGAWMNYVPQARELTEARAEFPWLAKAPGHCLQQTLMDLDKACRRHGTFAVRWRTKSRWVPSFRFPDGRVIRVERLGRKWGRVKLPKLGWVRFRWSRVPDGQIRSATVSLKAGYWYVSLLVEDGKTRPAQHASMAAVGVDRGVKIAVTTSDGNFYDRRFFTPSEDRRGKRLQQALSRSRRGSKNRAKIRTAFARNHARAASRREDFCKQTAYALTTRYGMVVLEDLKVKNMTASASGTLDMPGKGVSQKAGLNRAIRDKGWHKLELAIRSTARYTGTTVVKVNPAYTSQTCHTCKHVDPKSRESQAVFRCTACGNQDHADVNAAKNILAAGLAVTACGDLGVSLSAKQEPAPPRGQARRRESVGIPRH